MEPRGKYECAYGNPEDGGDNYTNTLKGQNSAVRTENAECYLGRTRGVATDEE